MTENKRDPYHLSANIKVEEHNGQYTIELVKNTKNRLRYPLYVLPLDNGYLYFKTTPFQTTLSKPTMWAILKAQFIVITSHQLEYYKRYTLKHTSKIRPKTFNLVNGTTTSIIVHGNLIYSHYGQVHNIYRINDVNIYETTEKLISDATVYIDDLIFDGENSYTLDDSMIRKPIINIPSVYPTISKYFIRGTPFGEYRRSHEKYVDP